MQVSALLVVDTRAALTRGTLESNVRLIHNTHALFDDPDDPTGETIRIVGAHRPGGAQATEAIINWLIVDIDPAFRSRIRSVRGPAVDRGAMFPALYLSPDPVTDGAYWSAGIDTEMTGAHEYVMDLTIDGDEPRRFEFRGRIRTVRALQVDGFTGRAEPGDVPLRPRAVEDGK